VPELSKKIFLINFPKLLSTGGGGGSDYEKFLLDSIFPTKLTEFPTKLAEFVPFIFIIGQYCPTVKRILPDWLCLPNFGCRPLRPPPPARYEHAASTDPHNQPTTSDRQTQNTYYPEIEQENPDQKQNIVQLKI
jgi:hypothetical protein